MGFKFELTEDERMAIRKFVGMLDDAGFEAALMVCAAGRRGNEIKAKAIATAIEDITDTCGHEGEVGVDVSKDIHQAAPSLALVVKYARRLRWMRMGISVPRDFLPSKKLVSKCQAGFFAEALELLAGDLSES